MRHSSNPGLAGLSALMVAALASLPLPASPAPPDPVTVTARPDPGRVVERVSYADLNLAIASDQSQLQRRVSNASHRVCSPHALNQAVSVEDSLTCSRNARRDAKPQIAQAIERARQLAVSGTSSIPVVAISVGARF